MIASVIISHCGALIVISFANAVFSVSSATSTASGLGQTLRGTGNAIYTKFLEGEGQYDHATMATDGDMSVKMTVAYLKYLLDNNGNDIKQALISYNGAELGPKYYETIDSYMVAKTSRGLSKAREYR
jgi:soluble lytic murein transglycosylase-like protein